MEPFADPNRALSLPPHPTPPRRAGFPLLAILAPVAAAGVLFALTRSPFSLAFAAIGPLVGIASMLDAARGNRRERRRSARERAVLVDALELEVAARHEQERERAWRTSPSLEGLAAEPAGSRWLDRDCPPLVVGAGTEPSSLRLDGEPFDDRDRELVAVAARLEQAPLILAVDGGIGFVGPELLARAAARAAVARCAITGMPGSLRIHAPAGRTWSWAGLLPHRAGERAVQIVDAADPPPRPAERGTAAVIAVATDRAALPPGLAAIVHVETARRAVVEQLGDPRGGRSCVPELLGERQALELAVRLEEVAARNALGGSGGLPERVELAALPQPAPTGRGSLAVTVGVGPAGPLELDLVGDGPHALVGGTTGSGKSEFLLAWLAALAGAFTPDRLAVLLVDFKGGAAFQPIAHLPHVTGIVTDLDESEALRAVQSLRAESRRRERVLREQGVRDIAELDDGVHLARLVIVVDEFQALIERFAELGEVIADLAARGRSLGMHLILATQRPNGVVREQISANCRLRVCLRVLQAGDSRAVVGVPDAAAIDPGRPGRAVLDRGDGAPLGFQSALADPLQLELVHAAHRGAAPAVRPWLDPLPAQIRLDALLTGSGSGSGSGSGGGTESAPDADADADTDTGDGERIVFGLADDPANQRRLRVAWNPRSDGSLIVVGVPGSGRSTALATVASAVAARHGAGAVLTLPRRRSDAWDLLRRLTDAGERPTAARLVVIDDLDTRFRSWPDDYRIAAEAMVESLVHASRGGRMALAASVNRTTALPAVVRDGFGAIIALRQGSRGDLVQLGGESSLWRADDRPGAGQWRGLRVQLALGAPLAEAPATAIRPLALEPGRRYALVAARPDAAIARLEQLPGVRVVRLGIGAAAAQAAAEASTARDASATATATVIVGDAEGWAVAWQLWNAIRPETTILVQGGLAEFRALVRERSLPPLLEPGDERGWSIDAGGRVARFAWPEASDR